MFVAPPESGKAQFYSNVSIAVQDLSSDPKTLEQYTDKAVQEIQEYLTESMFWISPTPTSLGNHAAYQVMYTGKVGEQEVQRFQVWTMKEDQVYVITYESEKSQFKRVFTTVKEMIESLEIEEVNP
jgi:serine/threonine-protein kinase